MSQDRASATRRIAAGCVATAALVLWAGGIALGFAAGQPADAIPATAALAFAVVGVLVLLQRPGNALGPVMCAFGIAVAVLQTGTLYATRGLVDAPGSLPLPELVAWLSDLMALPVVGLFVGVMPQLFPDGRPLTPRWRFGLWAAYGFIAVGAVGNAVAAQDLESVPGMANPYALPHQLQPISAGLILLSVPCGLVAVGASVATLWLRWRRSYGDERQQLKWYAAGVAPVLVPVALNDVAPVLSGALFELLMSLTAVTMGVAILRYRLYDLDLVLRRTLAYGLVIATVALLYLAVVAASDVLAGGAALGWHVAAAVAAAAVFHPLLALATRWVDRLFYGDRARPYDALSRLGVALEGAVLPEQVLPGIVETVASALRLPYVAIELVDDSGYRTAAESGRRPPHGAVPERFPLTYQGVSVGRLLASPRRTEETLHPADRQVLIDLARHASVAAQAVSSSLALQRSRVELVAAREEERRRLRRDLHDGLGPALAGVTLGLHAAQRQLPGAPEATAALLADLEQQVETAVADVRRLVYGLRPPALDEFGLVRAVAMHAARLESATFAVHVTSATPLGRLPAAVEVAAYRIATEALTNVSRHAGAHTCGIDFTLNGRLQVQVSDDGHGIREQAASGVGLLGMRERAAELGGTLRVESGPHGTVVTAQLPVERLT